MFDWVTMGFVVIDRELVGLIVMQRKLENNFQTDMVLEKQCDCQGLDTWVDTP